MPNLAALLGERSIALADYRIVSGNLDNWAELEGSVKERTAEEARRLIDSYLLPAVWRELLEQKLKVMEAIANA